MSNLIAFPLRNLRPSIEVLIWKSHKGYHVTVFDYGHERETTTHGTYDAANGTAASWIFLGATIEDRVMGGDA